MVFVLLITACNQDLDDESFRDSSASVEDDIEQPLDNFAKNTTSGYGNEELFLNAGANPEGSDGKCRPWGGVTGSTFRTLEKNLNRSSYNIRFEFKFDKYFDFDKGGKIGYGMGIGDYITGCRGAESQNNKGGSFRIMWRGKGDPNTGPCTIDNRKTTRAVIIPYLYHRRMPKTCGDDFGKEFPIVRDQWYTVVMKYKANTGSKADGIARIEIGKHGEKRTILLNRKNMVWSFSKNKRNVTRTMFHLFRGGGGADWASHTKKSVKFRSVKIDY